MAKQFLLFAGKEIDTDTQTVKVNQVVQLEGYNYPRFVVYEITKDQWGVDYKLINLNDFTFDTTSLIRPLSEKFGIGIYYDDQDPQFKTNEEVAEFMAKAQEKQVCKMEKEREEEKQREAVKIIGRKWLDENLPEDTQALIIACLKEDKSDRQTDYFSSRTIRTVILGFSKHQRDIFSEMRKYASNFNETAYLSEYNEDYEHREKYSMGAGYYLGESYYSGWVIKKVPIYNRESAIKEFSFVAGNSDNIHIKSSNREKVFTSVEQTSTTEALQFEIVDYSEKAIAFFGDTKAIKDLLSAMGGKFNPRLTHNGEKQAGWIFPKSKRGELDAVLKLNNN